MKKVKVNQYSIFISKLLTAGYAILLLWIFGIMLRKLCLNCDESAILMFTPQICPTEIRYPFLTHRRTYLPVLSWVLLVIVYCQWNTNFLRKNKTSWSNIEVILKCTYNNLPENCNSAITGIPGQQYGNHYDRRWAGVNLLNSRDK